MSIMNLTDGEFEKIFVPRAVFILIEDGYSAVKHEDIILLKRKSSVVSKEQVQKRLGQFYEELFELNGELIIYSPKKMKDDIDNVVDEYFWSIKFKILEDTVNKAVEKELLGGK